MSLFYLMNLVKFLLNDVGRHDFILGHLKSPILEIGTDTGKETKKIRELGYQIVCTDINPSRAIFIQDSEIIRHDIEKEKITFGKFNTILLFDVIEHLQHPNAALQNIRKALNEKGKLIVATPNVLGIKNRMRFLFGDGSYFAPERENEHIRFFTPQTLDKIMEQNGFQKIEALEKGSITSVYERGKDD